MTDALKVNLGGVTLKNPVVTASGTFGYGREYHEYYDIAKLGALIIKGTTLEPRPGNPGPRVYETPAGMLNAIGLENPGVDVFLTESLPWLNAANATTIANVSGSSVEEYGEIAAKLEGAEGLSAIELNISCPNVKEGGLQFGTDPHMVRRVVETVKQNTTLPVIPKLSPNVTDITEIARAAEDGGANALSMINTLQGMAIDVQKRRPVLANIFGGLSGPAIKPVALRMVYQVYEAVKIPILGGGGILNTTDALEFILAGATAVTVGTANFVDPLTPLKIIAGLEQYLAAGNIASIAELTGAAHL